jgi:hypothetical protein
MNVMKELLGTCKISVALAYLMLVYILACIYYLVRTRTIGTPFADSLTKKQKAIKAKAASQRKNIFYQGIIGAIIGIVIFRPFNRCAKK